MPAVEQTIGGSRISSRGGTHKRRIKECVALPAGRADSLRCGGSRRSLCGASSQRSQPPRQALAAASQASTFESQSLESQLDAEMVAPIEGSHADTATTEAGSSVGDGDDDRAS